MFVGVDTHKSAHVLVAIDAHGRTSGTRAVPNTPEGWATALSWARQHASPNDELRGRARELAG